MTTRAEPPGESRNLDARMRVAIKAVGVAGAVLAALGLALGGLRVGGSSAAGAALATGNLWALARVVAALLPEPPDAPAPSQSQASHATSARGAWALLGLLKTVGLLVAAWLVLRYRVADPLPMLVGFGALPIGIAIGALVSDRRPEANQNS